VFALTSLKLNMKKSVNMAIICEEKRDTMVGKLSQRIYCFLRQMFFSKSRLASEHVIVEGDKDDLGDRSSASLRLIKGNAIILELIESIFHIGVIVTVGDKRIPGKRLVPSFFVDPPSKSPDLSRVGYFTLVDGTNDAGGSHDSGRFDFFQITNIRFTVDVK